MNKPQELLNEFYRLSKEVKSNDDKCMRLTYEDINVILTALKKEEGVSLDEAEKAYAQYEAEVAESVKKFEEENPHLFS